jgi:hypothetical protein
LTASHGVKRSADPLWRAWLLGIAAVAPLFIGLWLGVSAVVEAGDTAPWFLAVMGLPFLASGAIVTSFAGVLLARSRLYRWAQSHPPAIPAIVGVALLLVLTPFLEAASGDDRASFAWVTLGATELSIALTWLAAVRVTLAAGVAAVLGVVLLLAVA